MALGRETTEGNVRVGYLNNNMVAEVFGFQVGQDKVYVSYTHPGESLLLLGSLSVMAVRFENVEWNFQCSPHGKVYSILPGRDHNDMTPQEDRAFLWSNANEGFTPRDTPSNVFDHTPVRLEKAQKIYDRVLEGLMKIPLIKRYIDELPNYLKEKKESRKTLEDHKRETEEFKQKMKEFKGKPDPLDSLVAIVEAESK